MSFLKAEAKNSANYIIFSDDEYEIRFSKSLVKIIEIKTKDKAALWIVQAFKQRDC